MGIILSFTPQKAGMKKPSGRYGVAAAVVIFPGIRYERAEGKDPAQQGKSPVPTENPVPAPKH